MFKKSFFAIMTAGLLLVSTACQSGGTTNQQAEQTAQSVDLTKELTINPNLVVGKTTYAELEKAYGKPAKAGTFQSPFRKKLTGGGANSQPIAEWAGVFNLDLETGKKGKKAIPLFFTQDKKMLVASAVLLSRGDLAVKAKEGKLTLDDVKKVYGEPNRGNEQGLEYYDFANKIVLLVMKNDQGRIEAFVTKYALLYADNPTDLAEHEKIIQELGQEEKAKNTPTK